MRRCSPKGGGENELAIGLALSGVEISAEIERRAGLGAVGGDRTIGPKRGACPPCGGAGGVDENGIKNVGSGAVESGAGWSLPKSSSMRTAPAGPAAEASMMTFASVGEPKV